MMDLPVIKEIWDVHTESIFAAYRTYATALGDTPLFGKGKGPGNQQRRMHGTRMTCKFNGKPCGKSDCSACSILSGGFQMKYCRKGSAFFGLGIYCTSTSSGACRYARYGPDKKIVNGAVIMLGVACGKATVINGDELKDRSMEDTPGEAPHLKDGCHSRIINDPSGSESYRVLAKKCGTPLLTTENEIVVFKDESTVPKYLIIFTTTNTHMS